ncbi:MAG: GNAT family N-acetyltransferase [Parvularcula sp.]|jgi:GNAT superfamily N-acetyltransferase|nr:GNAT family N-acetyltransferase [Parvularcula sp.]
MSLSFVRADLDKHREVLTRFNIEYLDWADASVQDHFGLALPILLGMPISEYVDSALEKLCKGTPPEGVFYVVLDGETAMGMGGLRRIRDGVGEIKRIYVSPASRGGGTGPTILERLVSDAHSFGHRELLLETGPFMTSAHRIYKAAGFEETEPYPGAEVPKELRHDWRFMRRRLC